MDQYTGEELLEALRIVSSSIKKCEKIQPKFKEHTPQYSLLRNRIKAFYISQSLLSCENGVNKYMKEELVEALQPISSIISKCEKAQLKFAEGSTYYTRFKNMIRAMYISRLLISDEIGRRV